MVQPSGIFLHLSPHHTHTLSYNFMKERCAMEAVPLSTLHPGQSCIIASILHTAGMRRRLLDLGFAPDACISVLYTGPSGSPVALFCKETVIALRRQDCEKIYVVQDRE